MVDTTGRRVPDARVTTSLDGRPPREITCYNRDDQGGCKSWELDGIGALAIVASRADGSSPVDKTIVIANRGSAACPSPAPQDVEIVLPDDPPM